jgi:glycosyltransferase involved in cell wall biosynthesis
MVLDALRERFTVTLATPKQSPPLTSRFDIVHVFRMAALEIAKPYLLSTTLRHLDLDDIESKTNKRIEAICRSRGDTAAADFYASERRRCELLEVAAFRTFDRIYVCSEPDRIEVASRSRALVTVLPNVIRIPAPPASMRSRSPSELFRFLFVGSLGYYPNSDGVDWFCREVVPLLAGKARQPFLVEVAGAGSTRRVCNGGLVRFHGTVPDVRPYYERCHAAIVPLHAGGGTRIKILEAFGYRCPVVSTAIGAEGLEISPNRDILIGDTAEDFADHCLALMQNPALADHLAASAFELVKKHYSAERLAKTFAELPNGEQDL